MLAASSAVEAPTETDTAPVPATRSANMSPDSVRLSPLAIGFMVRRARICAGGRTASPNVRSSANPAGPETFTLTAPLPTALTVIGTLMPPRALARSVTVCVAPAPTMTASALDSATV